PPTHGTLYFSDDDVKAYVEQAHAAGMQVALHTVGSAAIEKLLQAYENALANYPRRDHRHRIEHFELPAPGQAERARQLGVLLAARRRISAVGRGGTRRARRPDTQRARCRRRSRLWFRLAGHADAAGALDACGGQPLEPARTYRRRDSAETLFGGGRALCLRR